MDLTPDLLRTVEFHDAKKGGYDHDEVDEFLDRAAADLARQHTQLRELEARATQAEQRAMQIESEVRERSDSDETLRRTLVLAQRTADAAVKEAQDEGARIVAEARQKADGMIASAEEQVRREVGATRDRLQAEIRDLEGRRSQLHDRITELSAHLDHERDRLRSQIDQLRAAIEDETLAVAPIPAADDEPTEFAPSEPIAFSRPPEVETAAPSADDAAAVEAPTAAPADEDQDLSDLPPPPIDWDRTEEEEHPPTSASLFPAPGSAPTVDEETDGGPPTQATPAVQGVGASHLNELRRAVSEGPAPEQDDAAMAAFFDQDDEEERGRRFGRRH